MKGIYSWRQKWLENGSKWADSKERPQNWSLEDQYDKFQKNISDWNARNKLTN